MIERHNNFISDYTYSIGYPEGVVPTIIRGDIIKELQKLVEEDDTIKKDYLFYSLSKDINSFDIETFLSDYDLRIYRIKFGSNDVGEEILTKNIFDVFKKDFSSDKIAQYLKDNLDKIYTVPYMLNLEITNKKSVDSIYLPKTTSDSNKIDLSLFKKIVNQFNDINSNFYLVFGGFGEPFLHSGFLQILDFVNKNKINTIIETYGIDMDKSFFEQVEKLDKEYLTFVFKIDSYFETTYNKIHANGNFNKAIENYRALKSSGYKVYKQITRMVENEEEIEKYIKNKDADDLIIRKFSTYCGKLEDKKVVDLSPLERIPCFHLRRELFVNSYGKVSLCHYNYDNIIGDFNNEDINSIIKKIKGFYQDNANKNLKDGCINCDDYYLFNF
ncbi:MAG TPA: spiro-SPASM protein, partial [Spirochaetota bacterium]|nr:spiro-SPASM protein [Spirochaetota bacterium]